MIMKNIITDADTCNLLSRKFCYMMLIMGMLWISSMPAFAQETQTDTIAQVETDTTVQEETEVEEIEEDETLKSRMSLTADQFPDNTIVLSGLLRAKIEASYQKIPGRKITFFTVNAEGEETEVGDTITGANGIARLRLIKTNLSMNEEVITLFWLDMKVMTHGWKRICPPLRPAKLIMEP